MHHTQILLAEKIFQPVHCTECKEKHVQITMIRFAIKMYLKRENRSSVLQHKTRCSKNNMQYLSIVTDNMLSANSIRLEDENICEMYKTRSQTIKACTIYILFDFSQFLKYQHMIYSNNYRVTNMFNHSCT